MKTREQVKKSVFQLKFLIPSKINCEVYQSNCYPYSVLRYEYWLDY